MCFYITSTLPKTTDLEILKPIFNKFNMAFQPINNPSIQKQLKSEELYFRIAKESCDCDTYLGLLDNSEQYKKMLYSSKVKKLRKNKWSEEKIDEWIRSKINNINPIFERLTETEKNKKYERWVKFIESILGIKKIKHIGILKHWYRKGLENEEFIINNTYQIKINEINEDILLHLEEDVLYEFIPLY